MKKRTVWTAVTLIAAAILAGCSGQSSGVEPDEGQFTGAFAHDYETIYRWTTSDAVRSMVADGQVSAAERAEALAMFIECGAAEGVTFTEDNLRWGFGWQEGDTTPQAERDRQLDVWIRCDEPMYHTVIRLFDMQLNNPDSHDLRAQDFACLQRNDLVPDGFTLTDYEALIDTVEWWPSTCEEALESGRYSSCSYLDSGGLSREVSPDWSDPPLVLPNGVSLDDGPGWNCRLQPW